MDLAEKKRIVFLCSGGGGNLRFIYRAIERRWIDGVEISAVLTDRECPANLFAASVNVRTRSINFSGGDQQDLLTELIEIEPDLIITTVHKILTQSIVDEFRDRLINLHYSLLPAFGGLIGVRPVRAAMDFGARFTGVTTHLVDESIDGGKPIVQVAIPLYPKEEDFDALMNLVFRCGCIALMTSINIRLKRFPVFPGTDLALLKRTCWFSAEVNVPHELFADESFWQELAIPSVMRLERL